MPLWIFNSGQNPKRPKGLSLAIVDKKTAFASLTIANLSHLNDLKWAKPGHLTLKLYPHNVLGPATASGKTSRQKATAREMNGHDVSPQGCAMCLSLGARRRLTPEDAGLSKKIPASAESDYGLGAASR